MIGNLRAVIFILCFLLALPAYSFQQSLVGDWPKLEGDQNRIECIDAFALAKAKFKSEQYDISNFYIDSVSLANTKFVPLQDESIFEKIDRKSGYGDIPVHWQRQAANGARWVVKQENYAWRGNKYALYLVPANISSAKFLADPGSPVIEEQWNKPVIMQEKATRKLWALDVGEPFIPLSDWTIFTAENGKPVQLCKIHFCPQVEKTIQLLPLPVRQFEKFLDGTLGTGSNEGTLSPTARIRNNVSHVWANIALRPWSLFCVKDEGSCNASRKETDKGLQKWSHGAASFKQLYDKIYQQYPKAEKALSKYYEHAFKVEPEKAKIMARNAIKEAFISHYEFDVNYVKK